MLLDWSRGLKVSTFRDKHRPAVVDTVLAKNLSREFDSETLVFFMDKENAAEVEVRWDIAVYTIKRTGFQEPKAI